MNSPRLLTGSTGIKKGSPIIESAIRNGNEINKTFLFTLASFVMPELYQVARG
jgi:hypothetical protein